MVLLLLTSFFSTAREGLLDDGPVSIEKATPPKRGSLGTDVTFGWQFLKERYTMHYGPDSTCIEGCGTS